MMHHVHHHTQPAQLEKYSFLWSEARLIVAALALFLGGVPPIMYLAQVLGLYNPLYSLLTMAWILSGLASAYMLYRWNMNGRKLFGAREPKDMYAFFVSVISGLNLGFAGLLGTNIGMSISSAYPLFIAVGVAYILSAVHLNKRWREHGQKIF